MKHDFGFAFNDGACGAMTNDKSAVWAQDFGHLSCARQSAVICHLFHASRLARQRGGATEMKHDFGFAFNDGAFGARKRVMRPQAASLKAARPKSCAEGAVICHLFHALRVARQRRGKMA